MDRVGADQQWVHFAGREIEPNTSSEPGATSQRVNELVGRNVGLAQNAGKRSDFDLTVHRHHTAFGSASHYHVTAGLTNLCKTKMLKGSDDFRP